MFNGDSWSLIDKGIFYRATFNFKMLIFNVYKNLVATIAIILRCYKKNARIIYGILMEILL